MPDPTSGGFYMPDPPRRQRPLRAGLVRDDNDDSPLLPLSPNPPEEDVVSTSFFSAAARKAQKARPAHSSPYTLHPTHYTLHMTPHTLHFTPFTPHPTGQSQREGAGSGGESDFRL